MITYAITLLTPTEDVLTADTVRVRVGTDDVFLRGEMVKAFMDTIERAYATWPDRDCLRLGLEIVPEELRPIFAMLYEELT